MMRSARRSRLALVATLAILTAGLLASTARALDCPNDCMLHRRSCMQEARTTMRRCGERCRTPDGPSDTCMRTCVPAFVKAKQVCREGLHTCLHGCGPQTSLAPPPSAGCRNGCGAELLGCVRDVQAAGRQCLGGCDDAPDRAACTMACNGETRRKALGCRVGLRTCLARCAGTAVPPAPRHRQRLDRTPGA